MMNYMPLLDSDEESESFDSFDVDDIDPWDCDITILTNREKIHVFLDLDNTLICSILAGSGPCDFVVQCAGRDIPVIKRPGVEAFLERLSHFAHIYLYTAAQYNYASQILDNLNAHERFVKIFSRTHCERLGPLNYRKRWDDCGVAFVKGQTFIVDDTPSNFGEFSEHGISISPFHGELRDDELHRVLRKIFKRSG
jgi:RNA polymerase II subunit A small phosphatase-like protein